MRHIHNDDEGDYDAYYRVIWYGFRHYRLFLGHNGQKKRYFWILLIKLQSLQGTEEKLLSEKIN